jgi:arsenite-transporting ATPase
VLFRKWWISVSGEPLYYSTHSQYHTADDQGGMMSGMMQDLAFAIPGVDEAMSFAEIMK